MRHTPHIQRYFQKQQNIVIKKDDKTGGGGGENHTSAFKHEPKSERTRY